MLFCKSNVYQWLCFPDKKTKNLTQWNQCPYINTNLTCFLMLIIWFLFGFIFYFTTIACYLYFWAGKMDGVKNVLLKMGSNVSTAQQNNFLHPFFCREMLHSSCIHPTTTGISIKSSIYNQKTWLPLFIWATIVKINTLHFL